MIDWRRSRPLASGALLLASALLLMLMAGAATHDDAHGSPIPFGRPAFSASSAHSGAPACPLTPPQVGKAVEAFEKMMPVVLHPRCFNCHGGVNPFVERSVGGHGGGKMDLPEHLNQCQECHSELPGWTVAPEVVSFVGKSKKELCAQFKDSRSTGPEFVGHMLNDNGGVQLIAAAFKGDRALNDAAKDDLADATGVPFVNQPPPMPHQQLVAIAQDWVEAMGAGWSVPGCGCELKRTEIVGTVSATYQLENPDVGTFRETAKTTIRFEIDSTVQPAGEYWKSTTGAIHWQASATGGRCTGSAAGTIPVSIGGDDNPSATLDLSVEGGATRYVVSVGPMPDENVPRFRFGCRDAPPIQASGWLFATHNWWNTDPAGERLMPDGKSLIGNYRRDVGPGQFVMWSWNLRLTSSQ